MIGIDLVSISRIESLVQKYDIIFLKKILNNDEISLVRRDSGYNVHRIAGFFAAKEALSKALGCGIGGDLRFCDICIHKDKRGKPQIRLDSAILKRFGIGTISLSISHDKDYAIAVVQVDLQFVPCH